MAVYSGSRFEHCECLWVEGARFVFGERAPYRYTPHSDNQVHKVVQGDTLPLLAGRYFAPLPRACGYWWAIAEFQPEPIINPLTPLHLQRSLVVVPSVRVLTDVILRPRGKA